MRWMSCLAVMFTSQVIRKTLKSFKVISMDEVTVTLQISPRYLIHVPKKYLQAIGAGPDDWIEIKIKKVK